MNSELWVGFIALTENLLLAFLTLFSLNRFLCFTGHTVVHRDHTRKIIIVKVTGHQTFI